MQSRGLLLVLSAPSGSGKSATTLGWASSEMSTTRTRFLTS